MKFPSQPTLAAGLVSLLLASTGQAAPQQRGPHPQPPSQPPPSNTPVIPRESSGSSAGNLLTTLDDPNTAKQPNMKRDFPDPALLQDSDGTWYSFATASGSMKVQWATAKDPTGTWTSQDSDLLTDAGAWTNNKDIWAPDVRRLANGSYVMYYTAQLSDARKGNDSANIHCLGVATATSVRGPYSVQSEPWVCDQAEGGTIDSAGFEDSDGTRYVVYKIDGNNRGTGGTCGNEQAPQKSTPLMLQKVGEDGITKVGDPVQILDRIDSDGPLIEAPNLIRADGRYILFFSSHCYLSTGYNVLYATADNVTGPYTRATDPLLATGSFNLTSPGGATASTDGTKMVFHANCPTNVGGSNRCFYSSSLAKLGESGIGK